MTNKKVIIIWAIAIKAILFGNGCFAQTPAEVNAAFPGQEIAFLNFNQELKLMMKDGAVVAESNFLKEIEREKLRELLRLSEIIKNRDCEVPKIKAKSVDNCKSIASPATDRPKSRKYGSKESRTNRYSPNIFFNSSKTKEMTTFESTYKALDIYSPEKSLTHKIIAFNRRGLS